MSWGYHLLLNCRACDREAVNSEDAIRAWLSDLLARIKMESVGPPDIRIAGTHDPALIGPSLTQIIQTSHIGAHFMVQSGDAYIDVFSCKDFNTSDVEDCVRRHFRPEHVGRVFLERQA